MLKQCIVFLGAVCLCGCHTVTDAGADQPLSVTTSKQPSINPGSVGESTNPFVGIYGDKTPKKGMQVKFGSDGMVSVDGQATSATGTYTVTGHQAQANFTKTNVARFDRVMFNLSDDGKTLRFSGPLNTKVTLSRTGS